ncbi:hypothetical protein MAAFP003_3561 [Mycobacterium ahvazicum]|uniref:Uncharacterized protein n=1 Tax=Mycobacterium ahvazicum TaxID=1964395 RepID=A0A2K4YDM2_9MYCO|nr:hypothetical protein [Mycobacterium ahvazicum]SOX54882.1 hypothetical protein MAAFP003_3561 [Mycobacterium ahvazicum]
MLLLANGFAELEPDVLGPDAWCEPHAVTATQHTPMVAFNRNMGTSQWQISQAMPSLSRSRGAR